MSSSKASLNRLLAGVLLVAVLALFEVDAWDRKAPKPAEPKISLKKVELSGPGMPRAPRGFAAPQEANVEKIKEKYWARGNEAAVGVVQNRLFTKEKKLEIDVTLGTVHGAPFLAGEGRASLPYGRVSLLGAAILYFDAYFRGASPICRRSRGAFRWRSSEWVSRSTSRGPSGSIWPKRSSGTGRSFWARWAA